ncbi:MAG: hypothetical protein ABSG26_17375 [Bryobacteraceae bacterium]|jgi:hypothetical protein
MAEMEPTWREYHLRLLAQFGKDVLGDVREFRSGTMLLIALIAAVLVAILENKWRLIQPNQTWETAIVNAIPTICIFLFYLGWHALRAPWKLDIERQRKINDLLAALRARDAELGKLKPRLNYQCVGANLVLSAYEVYNSWIGNSNVEPNQAYGVHGALDVSDDAHNPIRVPLGWLGEPPDDPVESVSIPGGSRRAFAYLVQDKRNKGSVFIPQLMAHCFGPGQRLTPGPTIYTLVARVFGGNCDPLFARTKFRVLEQGILVVEPWTTLPSSTSERPAVNLERRTATP